MVSAESSLAQNCDDVPAKRNVPCDRLWSSQPRQNIEPPKRPRKQRRNPTNPTETEEENVKAVTSIPILLANFDSMATPIRLLVCSIGNPAPYTNTFHSAGHTVLSALAASLSYPPFQKAREYGKGLVSAGLEFTLWQSGSLMNVSGSGLSSAWRQFQKDSRGDDTRLVVVHDELELKLGDIKIKDGGASAKGHNGLKDIAKYMKGQKFVRIGIGIGRPQSREPDVVAAYVLKKMDDVERAKIINSARKVEVELRRMIEL